jgi:DNA polymerase III subunit epsilon
MRQIVLDTETTGLEVAEGHRIIELACVELLNRRPTGRTLHKYVNPERDIDEGALAVHGITRERLANEPKFADIAAEFIEFVRGAELIIHNAPFDVAFLDAELARQAEAAPIAKLCTVLDTLALARRIHPGQRNNLDALCKRYSVDNSQRDYHGALLDARILLDVYLAMTGGQAKLVLGTESERSDTKARRAAARQATVHARVAVIKANGEELAAHDAVLLRLDKASKGRTVWRHLEGAPKPH